MIETNHFSFQGSGYFVMIYPDDGMIVMFTHGISPLPLRAIEITAGGKTGSVIFCKLSVAALIFVN